jgi:hypothetical protein
VRIRRLVLACGMMLMQIAGLQLVAQQAKAPDRKPPAQPVPTSARVWRSITTRREYRVWVENDRLHTEWVNLPPAAVQAGAYVRSESQRAGSKWVGTARSYLPCDTTEASGRVSNRCKLLTKIEFTALTPDRITGRAEALRRWDCARCQILETVWKEFEWVPKEGAEDSRQKAEGSKQ